MESFDLDDWCLLDENTKEAHDAELQILIRSSDELLPPSPV